MVKELFFFIPSQSMRGESRITVFGNFESPIWLSSVPKFALEKTVNLVFLPLAMGWTLRCKLRQKKSCRSVLTMSKPS